MPQIKITQPGEIYRLGKGIGAVKVLGLADTGRKVDAAAGVIYDDCYQEGGCSGPLQHRVGSGWAGQQAERTGEILKAVTGQQLLACPRANACKRQQLVCVSKRPWQRYHHQTSLASLHFFAEWLSSS